MNPEMTGAHRPAERAANRSILTTLAESIQPAIAAAFEGNGGARSTLKDFLHGTWLGHPLHPLVTDIPIGAWSLAALFDTFELCGSERYQGAADVAIAAGAAGAVAAAVTGLADWSDTKDAPQRVGMLHALLNTAALACYTSSLVARRAGARPFGIASALMGYGLVVAAGYLGGELAYGLQLGVNHSALAVNPPGDFVRVLDAAALTDGEMKRVEAGGLPVLLTRTGDSLAAVSAVCTHRGAPLDEGERSGDCIACPWHGSRFSLVDGHVVEGPATFDLARFDARIDGGDISVRGYDTES